MDLRIRGYTNYSLYINLYYCTTISYKQISNIYPSSNALPQRLGTVPGIPLCHGIPRIAPRLGIILGKFWDGAMSLKLPLVIHLADVFSRR